MREALVDYKFLSSQGGPRSIDDVEAIFIDLLAHAESGQIQSCAWTRPVLLLETAGFETR